MSNFVRSLADDELRLRQTQSFGWGQLFVGTAVNPLNFVLKNPAASGKVAVVTRWLVASSVANSCGLFLANGDPALAAGGTPLNRFASGTGAVTTEVAIAPIPANFGQYAQVTLAAGIPAELIGPGQAMAVNAAGFYFVSFPAVAGNYTVTVNWYELPA